MVPERKLLKRKREDDDDDDDDDDDRDSVKINKSMWIDYESDEDMSQNFKPMANS
jgi:hypothetical protein